MLAALKTLVYYIIGSPPQYQECQQENTQAVLRARPVDCLHLRSLFDFSQLALKKQHYPFQTTGWEIQKTVRERTKQQLVLTASIPSVLDSGFALLWLRTWGPCPLLLPFCSERHTEPAVGCSQAPLAQDGHVEG